MKKKQDFCKTVQNYDLTHTWGVQKKREKREVQRLNFLFAIAGAQVCNHKNRMKCF